MKPLFRIYSKQKMSQQALSKYEKEWSLYWFEFIDQFPDTNKSHLKYKELSSNSNLTIDVLLKYPDKPWDWERVSKNKSISLEDMIAHPELPWYESIKRYKRTSTVQSPPMESEYTFEQDLQIFKESRNLGNGDITTWEDDDWYDFSSTLSLTMDFVETHIDKQWDWKVLSLNPTLTLEFVINHWDKDWCWFSMWYNQNITIESILSHPELPWTWYWVFCNPNLTIEVVLENMHRTPLPTLFYHRFMVSKERYIERQERQENIDRINILKKEYSSIPAEVFDLVLGFL